jgi:hypothetical protein
VSGIVVPADTGAGLPCQRRIDYRSRLAAAARITLLV